MARQIREIRLGPEAKRDEGKFFVVTEMSALAAEKWGRDAFKALAAAGFAGMPDDLQSTPLPVLAGLGLSALASASTAEIDSLMARLIACVEYIPDPAQPMIRRVPTGLPPHEEDIAEVSTRLRLQKEAFELSLGFSLPAANSGSPQPAGTTQTL